MAFTAIEERRRRRAVLARMSSLCRVISGGQTGVDQMALRVAAAHGLKTGGSMPCSFMTERGPYRVASAYQCRALGADYAHLSLAGQYVVRTRNNVNDADATLVFIEHASRGTTLTIGHARKHRSPVLVIDVRKRSRDEAVREIVAFVRATRVRTLNVAGHRGSVASAEGMLYVEEALGRSFDEVGAPSVPIAE